MQYKERDSQTALMAGLVALQPHSTMELSVRYLLLWSSLVASHAIVNPNQQTANRLFQQQEPQATYELGPRTWQAGVDCLDVTRRHYFARRDHLTRSYNLLLTNAVNQSTPAAQIQDGFIKHIHESVSLEPTGSDHVYQLRIITDAVARYVPGPAYGNQLLYVDYYLLVVDSLSRLHRLMAKYLSHTNSWNPGAYFLILYNNVHRRGQSETVAAEIFRDMVDHYYVQRVAVLYATGDVDYALMGMDYYSDIDCRNMHVRQIGVCSSGRLQPVVGYPSVGAAMQDFFEQINMVNCTFSLCCSISAPFIEEDCMTGLELRIINFIKNRLKFDLNQTCVRETRGVQLNDGNWTGLLGELVDRDCDFIMGGFYPDNDVTDYFWTSDCYLTDAYTFFVKIADRRPPWLALYSIFEWSTWLCIIAILLVNWFFWWFIVNILPEPVESREPGLTAINTLAATICVSVNERPVCGASRLFFFWIAIYGVNLTSTYTSNLIVVLSDPGKLQQIDSIEDVIAAGIPFGGHTESRDWFENDEDMLIYDLYNDTYPFEPQPENLLAVKLGRRAILSSRMFILQNRISDDVYAFTRNVFSSPLQMIMKPGFAFLNDFNWLIRYMRDTGIVDKINHDFVYNNTYLNRIARMRPIFKDSAIVLTTEHLEGPFAVLIVGISAATLAFIAELCTFWIIDPCRQRHFALILGRKRDNRDRTNKPKPHRPRAKTEVARDRKRLPKVKWRRWRATALRDTSTTVRKPTQMITDMSNIQLLRSSVYTVNVMHNIRFTPLMQRQIILK